MPRHTVRDDVLQRRLVEQVALAVRRFVMLQRVVRQVLLALGEHHAVDLGIGAASDQGHVLIDLRQPAAQGGDRPLQRGVAIDQRLLMGKVPDAGGPVLQVDVAQPCARARATVRPRRSASPARSFDQAGRLGQQRRLGPFLQDRPARGQNRWRPATRPRACAAARRS